MPLAVSISLIPSGSYAAFFVSAFPYLLTLLYHIMNNNTIDVVHEDEQVITCISVLDSEQILWYTFIIIEEAQTWGYDMISFSIS